MIVTLVALLGASSIAAGVPRAVCPNRTIEVVAGGLVSLPCHLDPRDNVKNSAMDWKRADIKKVVYAYRHGQENHHDQMEQYRNRTTVNDTLLSRGDLTLWISSVQRSDSGPYKCFVPKLTTGCDIELIVVDQQNETHRDDSSTTGPPEEEVTEPGGRGGENRNAARAVITSTVTLCVLIGVLVLVKRGVIQKHVTRLRGSREPKTEAANGCELSEEES